MPNYRSSDRSNSRKLYHKSNYDPTPRNSRKLNHNSYEGDLSFGEENINVTISAVTTHSFEYSLTVEVSHNVHEGVDAEVSFEARGEDWNPAPSWFPIIIRTISGIITADGTRESGSGFTSEKLEKGIYRVTFTTDFTAGIEAKDIHVYPSARFSGTPISRPAISGSVIPDTPTTKTWGGIIKADGTWVGENFEVRKLSDSRYQVHFLNVDESQVDFFYPPWSVDIGLSNQKSGQGVKLRPGWDKTHFMYQTYELNKYQEQVPKDLSVDFSASVTLKKPNQ